jgi:two-component system cell cycle response regulator DivK
MSDILVLLLLNGSVRAFLLTGINNAMNHTPTVLLVDDNTAFRELLRDFIQLAHPGWRVLEASNGAEGVELAQRWLPDLIFLDLNMPVMNGYEAALRLQAQPTTEALPLVMMTNEDANEPLVVRLRTLCQGALLKPFSLRELERHLDRLVGLQPEKEAPRPMCVGQSHFDPVPAGGCAL